MSEVVKSDVVEGTVLDAPDTLDLAVSEAAVSAYAEVSPDTMAEAIKAGPEAIEAFKAKLTDVYQGSSLLILKATHAQTVASAYMVRLCDELADGETASPEVVIAELAKLDPNRPAVSPSRVTQYRNASKVLFDLGFANTDARVGQYLNLSAISTPLKLALAVSKDEGTDAAQAKFLELAGEALTKQVAAKKARAVTSTASTTTAPPATDAPPVADTQGSDGADTGSREPNLATDKGNGKDGVLLAIGELPVATVEDIARLYVLQHAIEFRISQADEAIREAARKLADVETTDADKAAETLARKAAARKAAPKPGPKSAS
jgi:hypothetical protein